MAVKVGSKYEWVRGDYTGNIETVSTIEGGFLNFSSGRRCSVDVFEEMMGPPGQTRQNSQQQTNQQNSYKGVTMVDFQQEDDGAILDEHGQRITVPSIPNVNSQGQFQEVPRTEVVTPPEPIKKVNPITLLINQSAKDESELTINYTVNIPRKSVYSLLKDSFPDIDIDNEILDTIFSEIDINILKQHFKTEILEKIKLHYK